MLNSRPIVPLTDTIARRAGCINGQFCREENQVEQADIKIAATALNHNEPVVAGNPTDFNRIPNVIV